MSTSGGPSGGPPGGPRHGDGGHVGNGAVVTVVNDLGQRAFWPAGAAVPAGWRPAARPMSLAAAVAAIEARDQDMPGAAATPGQAKGPPLCAAAAGPYAHEMVARQARRRPTAVAVVGRQEPLSYGELDKRASRLARRLAAAGAAPGAVVGACLDRGPGLVIAILAIMRAGAAYLPLDPALPPARLARACSRARPVTVITATGAAPSGAGAPGIPLDAPGVPGIAPPAQPAQGDACYVISTSGTTGERQAGRGQLRQPGVRHRRAWPCLRDRHRRPRRARGGPVHRHIDRAGARHPGAWRDTDPAAAGRHLPRCLGARRPAPSGHRLGPGPVLLAATARGHRAGRQAAAQPPADDHRRRARQPRRLPRHARRRAAGQAAERLRGHRSDHHLHAGRRRRVARVPARRQPGRGDRAGQAPSATPGS